MKNAGSEHNQEQDQDLDQDLDRFTDIQDLARKWDLVVIGAGLAGCLSAIAAAQAGVRVLLIDAKPKGRYKVCGGCLNQRAWQVLSQYELADSILETGCSILTKMKLVCGSQRADFKMPTMRSVSRTRLDPILIERAVELGVRFLPNTLASVLPEDDTETRTIELKGSMDMGKGAAGVLPIQVGASVVVAADGLRRRSLNKLPGFESIIDANSRIGVGATFASDSLSYAPDELTMVVGKFGYVGLARVEKNLLNVAAAIDPKFIKREKADTASTLENALTQANMPIPQGMANADWIGTPQLTRNSKRISGHRLLLLGDAAGYVEPFTGEGMAWALHSAALAAPTVLAGIRNWTTRLEQDWQSTWDKEIRGQQWLCRCLSRVLRMPRITAMGLPIARLIPTLPMKLFPHSESTNTTKI